MQTRGQVDVPLCKRGDTAETTATYANGGTTFIGYLCKWGDRSPSRVCTSHLPMTCGEQLAGSRPSRPGYFRPGQGALVDAYMQANLHENVLFTPAKAK